MKKSTWRRLGAFAVLPLVGASLAACGSDDSSGSDSKTITFAYQIANPDAKSVFATLAEEYEKTHKGVTVKTNPIALNTYGSTITTQLQAGNGPDVFFVNAGGGQAGSVGTLGEAGKLLDLTGTSHDGVVPDNAKASMSYDDKLVAVPSTWPRPGIIFSPMAAEQSGFTIDSSTTMDDVIAQCKKVADGGQAVFGLAGCDGSEHRASSPPRSLPRRSTAPSRTGTRRRPRARPPSRTATAGRPRCETVKDLYDNGCFQEGAAGAGFDALTNGMGQGQMLGFAAPGGAAKDIMDSTGGAVTLTVQAMPAPDGLRHLPDGGYSRRHRRQRRHARTRTSSLDFINWMSQPEQTQRPQTAAGDIPVGHHDSSSLLPQYAGVAGLIDETKVAQYPYLDWPNGEVYNALGTGVTGLLTGQMSVDDVLESMDKAWG